jgi:hypothetical protein
VPHQRWYLSSTVSELIHLRVVRDKAGLLCASGVLKRHSSFPAAWVAGMMHAIESEKAEEQKSGQRVGDVEEDITDEGWRP